MGIVTLENAGYVLAVGSVAVAGGITYRNWRGDRPLSSEFLEVTGRLEESLGHLGENEVETPNQYLRDVAGPIGQAFSDIMTKHPQANGGLDIRPSRRLRKDGDTRRLTILDHGDHFTVQIIKGNPVVDSLTFNRGEGGVGFSSFMWESAYPLARSIDRTLWDFPSGSQQEANEVLTRVGNEALDILLNRPDQQRVVREDNWNIDPFERMGKVVSETAGIQVVDRQTLFTLVNPMYRALEGVESWSGGKKFAIEGKLDVETNTHYPYTAAAVRKESGVLIVELTGEPSTSGEQTFPFDKFFIEPSGSLSDPLRLLIQQSLSAEGEWTRDRFSSIYDDHEPGDPAFWVAANTLRRVATAIRHQKGLID